MDRAFHSGAIATPPVAPSPPSIGFPMGIGPYPYENTTKVGPYWFYMVTEECRNVAALGGRQTPNHLKVDQMATAIQAAINAMGATKANSSHTHNVSDINGLQTTLNNLSSGITNHTHNALYNGSGTAILDASGNLTVTGNVSGFSDIRLKTEIEVIENALEKVKQIRGVTYTRTDRPEAGRQIGVIAQEVQAVQPELVLEGSEGRLSVLYSNMAGLLIEAVKELSAEVDALKEKIYGTPRTGN